MQDARRKRLAMRAMRRGIKEMDLILSDYTGRKLAAMDTAGLDLFEALLDENDHDILGWITGQIATPPAFAPLIGDIRAGAVGLTRPV